MGNKLLMTINNRFCKTKNSVCKIFTQMITMVKEWMKYFNQKTGSINNAEYFSLTPTGNAENVEAYSKVMDFAFCQSDVKNIAVTGPYGAGKSSFLRTYFKNNKRVLWISLASFLRDSEERKTISEELSHEENERRLELSIVQQIFYKFNSSTVPYSRLCKVEAVKLEWYGIRICWFILSILCVVGIWQPEHLLYYFSQTSQEWLTIHNRCIFWNSVVILLILLCLFAYEILRLLKTQNIQRVDVSGLGIQMSDKTERSILNQNIDEIIYYFAASKYRTVVFEDIDRFNDVDIFTKLREVNLLLNNADQIKETHKPIRFIYALKEGLFDDKHEKVKFFDLIIPIVPVVNASNSQHVLYKFLEENCQIKINDAWKKIIKGVSPFISDMRLLKNICNEFYVYKNQLPDCNLKVELLGMIIFKNFFPKEFVDMHKDRGVIKKLLEVKRQKQELKNERIISQIKEYFNEIKKLQDNNNDIETLKKMYYFEMMKMLAGVQVVQYNNERLYVTSIVQKPDWFAVLYANKIVNLQTGQVIDWMSVERNYNPDCTYEEYVKQIECKKNGGIDVLMDKISKLRNDINSIRRMTLVDLWSAGVLSQEIISKEVLSGYENKHEQELFGFLVQNGYLNERYSYYISIFYDTQGLRTRNDYYFEVAVAKGEENDWDKVIDYPQEVIDNIDVHYFKSTAIRNYNLCDVLLHQFETDKANAFFTLITQQKQDNYEFTDGYLKTLTSQEEREKFLEHLLVINNSYVSELIQLFLRDSSLPRGLVETQVGLYLALMMQDEERYSCTQELKDFIEQTAKIADILAANGINTVESLETFLKRYGFRFVTLDCDEAQRSGLLDVVIRERAYRIEKDMIEKIFVAKGLSLEGFQTRNYSTIRSCRIQAIVDYIDDEFESYLRNVYDLLDQLQEDGCTNVLYILNKEGLSSDAKKIFIRKQVEQGRISDVKQIQELVDLELCLELNWIVPTWSNIVEIWNRIGDDRSKLCLFITRPENYTVLAARKSCKFKWEECEALASFIAEEQSISEDVMRALLVGMNNGKITTYTGKSATPKRVEYLVKGRRISYSLFLYNSFRKLKNDSHIMFAQMKISDFCASYENGMLNSEEIKKLLCFRYRRDELQLLVKTLQEWFVKVRVLTKELALKVDANNFGMFESSILDAVITDIASPELQCKIIQFLDGDIDVIRERLTRLNEPYQRLGRPKSRPVIPYWPERESFINFLKQKGVVSSTSNKEGDKIQVNTTN